MSDTHLMLATAGHVDHGKSALVKALTGTDPDRLPEEKARGITIDLGFAHLELPVPQRPGARLNVGIVDVPGHEDFVKNMVSGVGAVEATLLVVAADDGWMPQTEEHLQILEYLGVTCGVVALTKADRLTPAELPGIVRATRARLAGTSLEHAAIVPTSVITGRGVPELRHQLATVLGSLSAPPDRGRPRLWIDRVFAVRGVGTVVTGGLVGGSVVAGSTVTVAGRGVRARIRSVQNHGQARDAAHPGMRTALNLVGESGDLTLARGDQIAPPDFADAASTCDVLLQRSAREPERLRFPGPAATLRLHIGTVAVDCRVVFAANHSLAPGEQAVAELRLARPLSLGVGDRFVLRDPAGRRTVAGGLVLNPVARPRRFRSAAQQAYLTQLAGGCDNPATVLAARVTRDRAVPRQQLGARLPFAAAVWDAAINEGVNRGELVLAGEYVVAAPCWRTWIERAAAAVDAHHAAHPTQNGLPVAQVPALLGFRRPWQPMVESLVAALESEHIERIGAALRRRGFRMRLPDGLDGAIAAMRRTLATAGLNPPARSELAARGRADEALQYLLKARDAVALTPNLVIATAALDAAEAAVRRFLSEHGSASVSALKQALNTSRRVMVPLLERFDRAGVTVRDGELRRLARAQPVLRDAGGALHDAASDPHDAGRPAAA